MSTNKPIHRPWHIASLGFLAFWLGGLIVLALVPAFPKVPVVPDTYLGPMGHVATHLVLTVLIYVLLASQRPLEVVRWRSLVAAIAGSLTVGIALEASQLLIEARTAGFIDVLYNSIGTMSAALMIVAACAASYGISKSYEKQKSIDGMSGDESKHW